MRPKLHSDITPNRLLAAIVTEYRSTLRQIAQERSAAQIRVDAKGPDYGEASGTVYHLDRERQLVETEGIKYAIDRWLGERPTESRRVIAQRAVRQLEASGLVILFGGKARYVKPTPEGLAAVPEVAQ